ncbi:phage tail tape measure protein [[Clostridium] scindens]|uniref:phage tail tape measure protein n=1 Tax=Clostridium scindens (strain JCM 10418 / VPI 12708) TaxID=29347 RepID=UPI002B2C1E3F|nr:hypothetical protein GAFPHCNK_01047 [[Clostridium] scindens]
MGSNNASGGDIEYIIRADDSRVESDLEQANKKVEKAVKKSADESIKAEQKKTDGIRKESGKIVENAEQAAEDVADAWKDAGKDAQKAMSDVEIGDVDIEVTADTTDAEADIHGLEADDITANVDADTGKAETAIKSVSRDQSIEIDADANVASARSEIESLADTAEEVGGRISDALSSGGDSSSLGNIGGVLKDSFSDAATSAVPVLGKVSELTTGLSGTQVAALGVGAAAVGAGAMAVGAANDMQGAMNGFLAETGKSKEETERYQSVLEDIYANNYGESFEDIAGAMAQVTKNMGDMDDASLQDVSESAITLRDTFGYDIPESTRAAKAMMDIFGVSGEDAMGMIAAGAQNGLDYSGELLDSISEYSVQFDKVGLDADDMFSIFQKGAETGAFNLDKVGDAVKEMSIRVVDGSDTTREGFETIGLNADEMASKFAAGGDSAKEAFQQTINALADMEDPLAQNTAGVDLFGTMWEDLGPEAVTALADIQEGAYDTGDAMGQIQNIKYDDLGSQFEELKRNVELLLVPIGEALIPLFSTLIESGLPVVTELMGPLISAFSELLGPVVTLISSAVQPLIQALIMLVTTAIQPLMPVLNALMGVFQAVFDSISGTVSGVIGNITNIFRNLIDFVNNVFSGNWKGAWENVKEIFRNAVDALVGIFKAPINAIVDGWNSLASSIGSIEVPDWVPIAGGKSFSLPKMSRLKIGMDYVPSDMFPAWLDEGEAVLTKEENALLRSYGGLEGMAAMIGRSGRDSVTVNVQSQSDIDYAKLGNAVADAMIAAGVGFKCEGVVFARLMKDMIDYV